MRVGTHAAELDFEEVDQIALVQVAFVSEISGVDLRELFNEHEQLLIGERLQPDDGGEHVAHPLASETPLSEAAAQRLV